MGVSDTLLSWNLQAETGGGSGWGRWLEVTASHHLPLSQSSSFSLSCVAERAEKPPTHPKLSAFSVSAQTPSKLNWKPSALHWAFLCRSYLRDELGEAEGGGRGWAGAFGPSASPGPGAGWKTGQQRGVSQWWSL